MASKAKAHKKLEEVQSQMSSSTDNSLDNSSTIASVGSQPEDQKCQRCNRLGLDCHILRMKQAQKKEEDVLEKLTPLKKRIAKFRGKLK